MLTIHQIINSPVPSNCFVILDKAVGRECVVVDPGSKSDEQLFSFLEKEGLIPQYIILTHEHFDHCWGVNELVGRYQIPIICSALCAECIKYEKRNCSVFYDNKERFVIEKDTKTVESINGVLPFCSINFKFFPTPGHTKASICTTIGRYLFTGDTLLKDVRTVTKLPTGSKEDLEQTLEILKRMKGEDLVICPGHGERFQLDEYDINKALF